MKKKEREHLKEDPFQHFIEQSWEWLQIYWKKLLKMKPLRGLKSKSCNISTGLDRLRRSGNRNHIGMLQDWIAYNNLVVEDITGFYQDRIFLIIHRINAG